MCNIQKRKTADRKLNTDHAANTDYKLHKVTQGEKGHKCACTTLPLTETPLMFTMGQRHGAQIIINKAVKCKMNGMKAKQVILNPSSHC